MEFTLHTQIKASAKDIYDTWLSSDGHTKMTGGAAIITDKANDSFTAWDGYISGTNIELKKFTKIVQTWRTDDFSKEEESSILSIELKDLNGVTEILLTHSSLPKHGEQYIEGWEEHYFTPMKAYFSK